MSRYFFSGGSFSGVVGDHDSVTIVNGKITSYSDGTTIASAPKQETRTITVPFDGNRFRGSFTAGSFSAKTGEGPSTIEAELVASGNTDEEVRAKMEGAEAEFRASPYGNPRGAMVSRMEVQMKPEGELTVSTTAGGILIEGHYGTVRASSTAGSIFADGVTTSRDFYLTSTSGSIRSHNIGAYNYYGKATTGSVDVSGEVLGVMKAEATSGSVRVKWTGGETVQADARSVSGRVRNRLLDGPLTIFAKSISGGVTVE